MELDRASVDTDDVELSLGDTTDLVDTVTFSIGIVLGVFSLIVANEEASDIAEELTPDEDAGDENDVVPFDGTENGDVVLPERLTFEGAVAETTVWSDATLGLYTDREVAELVLDVDVPFIGDVRTTTFDVELTFVGDVTGDAETVVVCSDDPPVVVE